VTSTLRKEQEEEARNAETLRDNRNGLRDAEQRLKELKSRLAEAVGTGIQNKSAEQLLASLQKDVRDLTARKDALESAIADRTGHLEKLMSWEASDRGTTEDDVRAKRSELMDLQNERASLSERLEAALERNDKLDMFHQASTLALTKQREKEQELEKVVEDKRRISRQLEDKDNALRAQGKASALSGKLGREDRQNLGKQLKDKVEKYKKMRAELNAQQAELVILQNTEQILKGKHKNLDDFLAELERKKGVEV